MFILRKLFFNGNSATQSNEILGNSYQVIDEENEKWQTMIADWKALNEEGKIHKFIVFNNGRDCIPLYKSQGNYIMTADGNTFDNLTFR